jgi:hypothetical protein
MFATGFMTFFSVVIALFKVIANYMECNSFKKSSRSFCLQSALICTPNLDRILWHV